MREMEVDRGGRVLRVRDAGAPSSDDRFAPPAHGFWLSENLPSARLVLRNGEGHLGIYDHLGEMLTALTEPDTAVTGGG